MKLVAGNEIGGRLVTLCAAVVMAMTVSMTAATNAAWSGDEQPLVPRQAILDTAPTVPTPSTPGVGPSSVSSSSGSSTSSSTSTSSSASSPPALRDAGVPGAQEGPSSQTLNGSVSRTDNIPTPPGAGNNEGNGPAAIPQFDAKAFFSGKQRGGNGPVSIDMNQLKALIKGVQESARSGEFGVFINGNRILTEPPEFGKRAATMSADDFRKLEHGVIGLESTVTFTSQCPTVIYCYPTCPAAEAGIKPGDLLIKAGDHVFKQGEGQAECWKALAGKADTPVDVTVLREGKEISFHLTRMNIEDIKDDRIRATYENLLSVLGPTSQ